MNTQKKFLKVLSMLTIILLIATIFIPGNGNRNAVASIGILGILLLFLSTLLPKIYKLTLNLLKNQGKTSPWSSLKSSEPVSETEELLWRQISYQITDKLQAAFPNATWEFQKPPSMKQLLCGNPIRLRTFHTEDYNFAEARMNQYGITPVSAASLLVFCLLYTPCVAAIASIKRELGSRWAVGVVIGQCVIAWVAAFVVYLVGSIL